MGTLNRPAGEEGFSVVEAVLALTLGALVIALVVAGLVAASRWSRALSHRSDVLEAVRTVWVVLDEELRTGRPGTDWAVTDSGVVALRAYRGVAQVCPDAGDSQGWSVGYRGRRSPDPDRDSVLVLGADGAWRAHDLVRVSSGASCGGAPFGSASTWVWEPVSTRTPVLARLFESGSYHLEDAAFRYRRGGGGRQPLTPELFAPGSGFRTVGRRIEVRVVTGRPAGSGAFSSHVWTVGGMNGSR